jgi:putative hydrolase of the HAD superfamily
MLSAKMRPEMVEALKTCKRHFKVGCITNNWATGAASVDEAAPARPAGPLATIMPLFDVVIESAKAGVRKPDPRIYHMMCEQIGAPPHRCVFIDDLGVNCKAAAQLGMIAIKMVSVDETLDALERATGLSFARAAPV